MPSRLTGGCQCGAVRYAIAGEVGEASICHCRMCQKAFAAPFGALGVVALGQLEWTRGAPAVFASSSAAERGFCAACGTPLTYRRIGSDEIEVALVTLDDPSAVPPVKEVGVEGRLPWLRHAVSGALPQQTTETGLAALAMPPVTSRQHPDHETPPDWTPQP